MKCKMWTMDVTTEYERAPQRITKKLMSHSAIWRLLICWAIYHQARNMSSTTMKRMC